LREKREETNQFVNGFMQAKNLIEKQMKIGKKIKDLKVMRQEKVEMVMKQKQGSSMRGDMQAVKSVLFDSNLIMEKRNASKMGVNASFVSYASENQGRNITS